MENRKSIMVTSVSQGVVWDSALVLDSCSYTSCLSPGDGPHGGHSDEGERMQSHRWVSGLLEQNCGPCPGLWLFSFISTTVREKT